MLRRIQRRLKCKGNNLRGSKAKRRTDDASFCFQSLRSKLLYLTAFLISLRNALKTFSIVETIFKSFYLENLWLQKISL